MSQKIDLSVVIPMKNEGAQLASLLEELCPVLESLNLTWELLFVNDGSTDDSLDFILAERAKDKRIGVLDLSRNFGKEAALSAGLHHARGAAVVTMDADGQHQPKFIPEFILHWQAGFEMVTTKRINRRSEGWGRAAAAGLFYKLFNWVSDVPLIPHAGDFRLFDRKVVEAYREFGERNRFNKGLFALLGFKQKIITHEAVSQKDARPTQWGWKKLFALAFDALFSFSKLPLRLWMFIGFTAILGSMAFLFYILWGVVLNGREVPGYASLLSFILLMGGVNMVGVGILGEYIHRIFNETKARPLYIVRGYHVEK